MKVLKTNGFITDVLVVMLRLLEMKQGQINPLPSSSPTPKSKKNEEKVSKSNESTWLVENIQEFHIQEISV